MFVHVSKITELIECAERCLKVLPEDQHFLHYRDLAATLQKLIDDEAAELDQMAEEWKANESANLYMEETEEEDIPSLFDFIGEDALIEMAKRNDWPGGI